MKSVFSGTSGISLTTTDKSPNRDEPEQNWLSAHESGAKTHEKSHDFVGLFSRETIQTGARNARAQIAKGEADQGEELPHYG
jgi:hypothetical protein